MSRNKPLRQSTYLNPEGLKRISEGHPWLTAKHLHKNVHLPKLACLLPISDQWYFLSPNSHLRLRRMNLGPTEIMSTGTPIVSSADFLETCGQQLTAHFTERYARKKQLVGDQGLFRWIFSESDGIPGLVVDVFDDILVCQIQSAPVEAFWPAMSTCLERAFLNSTGRALKTRVEKRGHSVRAKEGLPIDPHDKIVGQPLSPREFLWNGLRWMMTPGLAQKTGAYLDQLTNHQRAVSWAEQLHLHEALDICCFEGGFGLHLLNSGLSVTAVDASETALQVFQKNAALNQLDPAKLTTVKADAFEFLRDYHKSGQQTDLIVLDPPPLAKTKEQTDAAVRAFQDLNLRAILSLRRGGLLVSCSCSQAVGVEEMAFIFRKIAGSTGRVLKTLERRGPAPDHLAPIGFPEGEYLNAWFLQVD